MLNLKYLLFLPFVSFGVITGLTRETTGNAHNSRILFYNGATTQNYVSYNLATAEKVVDDTTYNSTKPITIFIHGWLQTIPDLPLQTLIEAYISNGNYNFFILDWSQAASSTNFVVVSSCVPQIGVALGTFLNKIFEKGVSSKDVHLVGFSLGSYIASNAGIFVQKTPSNKLARITGLDPANIYPISLEKTDATFVDIIHTDPGKLGTRENTGTVDFYPNYNCILVQPGCPFFEAFNPFDTNTFACSHNRAIELFSESVKNNNNHNFLSTLINKSSALKIQMGNNCPTNATGIYELPTNDKSLYSRT